MTVRETGSVWLARKLETFRHEGGGLPFVAAGDVFLERPGDRVRVGVGDEAESADRRAREVSESVLVDGYFHESGCAPVQWFRRVKSDVNVAAAEFAFRSDHEPASVLGALYDVIYEDCRDACFLECVDVEARKLLYIGAFAVIESLQLIDAGCGIYDDEIRFERDKVAMVSGVAGVSGST